MSYLEPSLRKALERAVLEARVIAETAARKALKRLAVDDEKAHDGLSDDDKALRRRLRARVRRASGETQADQFNAVVTECAYELWHRMLFARFLAENHLLIHPEHQVPVSLEDCREIARNQGVADGWNIAASFASRMLPQIFRTDDPVLEVGFAPEDRNRLERLLDGLSAEIFLAQDSLGWVYQFWQKQRKDEINAAGNKIGADELPAVTQLFTEPYMVQFLLHNTLGAWWAGKQLKENPELAESAVSEDELRQAVALPGVSWDYLRFVKGEDGEGGAWRPAAGTMPGWPDQAAELKVLDPCCGSGHFLVEAFHILCAMRKAEEGWTDFDAGDAVLRDNIFGLEIDPRCTQIAAFALAQTAWKHGKKYRPLPALSVACSGLAPGAHKEDWLRLVKHDYRLQGGMERLWEAFQQAPLLGSLLEPTSLIRATLLEQGSEAFLPLLELALSREESRIDIELYEASIAARGIASAARILTGKYHLVTTNVPYLGRGKQVPDLAQFCLEHYSSAKADIATVFVQRCLRLCDAGGSIALVTPQTWLFLTNYKQMRDDLLRQTTWLVVARLGTGAFETISGEVVNVSLSVISRTLPNESHRFVGLDASTCSSIAEKVRFIGNSSEISGFPQSIQRLNPNAAIMFEKTVSSERLDTYASAYIGLHVGDWEAYRRNIWEGNLTSSWRTLQNAVHTSQHYSGLDDMIYWPNNGQMHRDNPAARVQGKAAWRKQGVAISMMGDLPASLYEGGLYRNGVAVIIPKSIDYLPAIWSFCNSVEFSEEVRKIDQKLYVTCGTLVKVPFKLARWKQIASELYPSGLPDPESDDPTQWIFHGRPDEARKGSELNVAVARLLGYRWPAELDSQMQLSQHARELVACCDVLLPFADNDGIVCLQSVLGEKGAADRLRDLLAFAYGERWSSELLTSLISSTGFKGSSLADWLRDGFFAQHCKLFQSRPFIWQIWDGRKDGFSALVNYHNLDRAKLERLTFSYLGNWISRMQHEKQSGEPTAEARLIAAQQLEKKLKLILEGEPPYDIFVRWKPLSQQPLGWEPDINDGVRLNIRPFLEADILRAKPHIKYGVDRGKNPFGAPFGEVRDNDLHFTLAQKRAAREQAGSGA